MNCVGCVWEFSCLSRKQKAEDPEEVDCTKECDNDNGYYEEVDPTVDVDKLKREGYQVKP